MTLLVATCTGGLADHTRTLMYPSEDNINMREGTLEFWLKVPFDVSEYLPSGEEYQGLLSLVMLQGDSGALAMGYFAGAGYRPGAGLFCSMSSERAEMHGFFLGQFTPKPDEWHHLALTWASKALRFYLDGEMRAEKVCLESLAYAIGTIAEQPILLGDRWHVKSEMVIDEVRISSVARLPDELGAHGKLEVDPYTLILDEFEEDFAPDGEQRTSPGVIFAGPGGLPHRRCEFVEGRFGKGLAFFKAEDE